MNELEDLRRDCIDLLKRLDTQESRDYTEDIIEDVSNFCSKLEIFGPKLDEGFSNHMQNIDICPCRFFDNFFHGLSVAR